MFNEFYWCVSPFLKATLHLQSVSIMSKSVEIGKVIARPFSPRAALTEGHNVIKAPAQAPLAG